MTALLDVDQLRTFIAIAETGSFTRAADIVHKTQSAVSMQMKRLEERLDRSIFARDGRASKLTEDGERLLDYARRIVKLNVETIAAFSDELTGRVRLGVPDDYADRYLPEIMARFSRAYPASSSPSSAKRRSACSSASRRTRSISRSSPIALGNMTAETFRQERLLWATSNRHSTHHRRAPAARARPADLRVAPRLDRVPRGDRPALSRALFERQRGRDLRRGAVRACGVGVSGIRTAAGHARALGGGWIPGTARHAASGWCAIRMSAIRWPMRLPSTSSRRSTTCRRRRARRSNVISSAAVASSTRIKSAGASSICNPRRPPFTMIGRMRERGLLDEHARALLLAERRDAADMIAGDALGLGGRQHRGISCCRPPRRASSGSLRGPTAPARRPPRRPPSPSGS